MRVSILLVASVLVAAGVHAADATKPHPHQGSLKPYPRPPPALTLSAVEQAILQSGKPVARQTEGEAGGRGMSIFIVNAPPAVVWQTLNDFARYPQYIPEVKTSKVYKKDGGKIDVHFVLKTFGVSVEYFIAHDFNMAERWGTWRLDYSRESDLDDSVGFWRVSEVAGQPEQARVEYSVDIAIKGWVPGFVRSLLVDNGLKTATSWVKVQSEKRFAQMKKEAATTPPPPAVQAPAP
jgi:coenzyme Q-binding protein COQ10